MEKISTAKGMVAAINQLQEVPKVSGISKFSHGPKSRLLQVKSLIDWVLFVALVFGFFFLTYTPDEYEMIHCLLRSPSPCHMEAASTG